jgi:DNA-binding HxlR family transcriptional regulator
MLNNADCPKAFRSINDALDVLEGRWKLLILFALSTGPQRFRQLTRSVSGISDKTLSKELKVLEANVEYTITEHGQSLEQVVGELQRWGQSHRNEIIGR